MSSYIEVRNVSKSFSGRAILQNISLSVEQGTTVGLVGANGSGKSVLFKIKLYPRKWTRDFDPWPRSADTHLTHRGRSAAPVLHQFEVHPAGGEQRTAAVHVPQRELLGQRAPRELLRAHEGRAGQ